MSFDAQAALKNAAQAALFGAHWTPDPGPRPTFDMAVVVADKEKGDTFRSTDDRVWRRAVLGPSGVLCAWRADGAFCVWGPVEQIAEAVTRRGPA